MTVLFDNPDLGETDWGFTSDFRGVENGLGGEWPLQVRSVGKSSITLRLEGSLSQFKSVRLFDEQTDEWFDLKSTGLHTFDVSQETHSFRLELR